MKQSKEWINYEERLNRVRDYIYAHLDDELDLNTLADIAHLSPYHFHRIYRSARNETIAHTIRRLRLHLAAGQLANSDIPIASISKQAGYQNVQSFTRTFNETYGMPPARYRANGSHRPYQSSILERSTHMFTVTIKTLPNLEVVCVPHRGPYLTINRAFDQLFGWLGARNLINAETRMLGIYYDDPAQVNAEELRSRACATLSQTITLEPPLESLTIHGGEYAILTYQGPYAGLQSAYDWLFGTWLLQSGRALGDQPVFEEYLNSPMNTAPSELLTNIHLPLN